MMNEKRKHIIIFSVVYLLLVLFLQLINGWYENFSDATNYLWLADRYAEGNFKQAVNTYWGPMTSWLLLLLKPFFANPFFRFRILQLIIGWISLYQLYAILLKQIERQKTVLYSLLIIIPLIVSYAWFYLTPDSLLLFFSLVLIKNLLSENNQSFKIAVKYGLIGACMFFAKSAGLYFFIIIIAGKFVIEKSQWNFKGVKFNVLTAFFLLLFCSPWIYLISQKQGSFTLGTGSIHNYKLNAPRITPDIYGELGSPFNLGMLTEPNPPTAFDAWGEPAHQSYLSWEGMSQSEIRSHYTKVIFKNIRSARSMYFGLDTGTILALMMIIVFFIAKKELKPFIVKYNVLFFLFLANVLIYVPFFFMYRYTWPGVIALLLLILLMIERFQFFNKKSIQIGIMTTVLVLNLFTVYKDYSYTIPEKPVVESIWQTKGNVEMKRTAFICIKGDMRLSLVGGLTYYNHGQYYGALFCNKTSVDGIKKELKKYDINNLVCFDKEALDFVDHNIDNQAVFKSSGLTIYKIDTAAF